MPVQPVVQRLLGAHPKFQAYVDARNSMAAREQGTATSAQTLSTIMRSLPTESLQRFEALRVRCLELNRIATQIKDPGGLDAAALMDDRGRAGEHACLFHDRLR